MTDKVQKPRIVLSPTKDGNEVGFRVSIMSRIKADETVLGGKPDAKRKPKDEVVREFEDSANRV